MVGVYHKFLFAASIASAALDQPDKQDSSAARDALALELSPGDVAKRRSARRVACAYGHASVAGLQYLGSDGKGACDGLGFRGLGFSDLIEHRSFWGSGRPLGALEPSKKVGGFAPHLSK